MPMAMKCALESPAAPEGSTAVKKCTTLEYLAQAAEAMGGRPVAGPHSGSTELPRSARRTLRWHRGRAGALPKRHFDHAIAPKLTRIVPGAGERLSPSSVEVAGVAAATSMPRVGAASRLGGWAAEKKWKGRPRVTISARAHRWCGSVSACSETVTRSGTVTAAAYMVKGGEIGKSPLEAARSSPRGGGWAPSGWTPSGWGLTLGAPSCPEPPGAP